MHDIHMVDLNAGRVSTQVTRPPTPLPRLTGLSRSACTHLPDPGSSRYSARSACGVRSAHAATIDDTKPAAKARRAAPVAGANRQPATPIDHRGHYGRDSTRRADRETPDEQEHVFGQDNRGLRPSVPTAPRRASLRRSRTLRSTAAIPKVPMTSSTRRATGTSRCRYSRRGGTPPAVRRSRRVAESARPVRWLARREDQRSQVPRRRQLKPSRGNSRRNWPPTSPARSGEYCRSVPPQVQTHGPPPNQSPCRRRGSCAGQVISSRPQRRGRPGLVSRSDRSSSSHGFLRSASLPGMAL